MYAKCYDELRIDYRVKVLEKGETKALKQINDEPSGGAKNMLLSQPERYSGSHRWCVVEIKLIWASFMYR